MYSVANDPRPQMIPRPEMIPKLDRKWSRTANVPEPQMIPHEDRKWSRQKKRNGSVASWIFFAFYYIFIFYFLSTKLLLR